MNFKDWKIKVEFHEMEFDSIRDQRHEKMLMEETMKLPVNRCEFMPRQGDLIFDMEEFDKENPYEVMAISFSVAAKTVEFTLTVPPEEEEEDNS